MSLVTKNAQISLMILAEYKKTGSLRHAYDAVMGEGAYVKLAGEVYDELRAKKQ
jgi:hypothetical protein